MIDETLVARLSELSNIEVDAAERAQLAADLERILGYVKLLEHASLDVPETHASASEPHTRADEPMASLDRDVVLSQAPRHEAGGFTVPAFVDEG